MITQYYNKLTKPIRDAKIAEILESIDTGKIFPADTEFNFKAVSYTHLTLPTNREV